MDINILFDECLNVDSQSNEDLFRGLNYFNHSGYIKIQDVSVLVHYTNNKYYNQYRNDNLYLCLSIKVKQFSLYLNLNSYGPQDKMLL